jgi:methionyl-tRNA formyltransferase
MFNQYIVIGVGTIACNCALILKNRGLSPIMIESRKGSSISSENFCSKNEISYKNFNKEELADYLNSVSETTLIVSASNRYIFPEEIIDKENLLLINFHGSLLPKFPGRNAEAWAIFEEESIGGISWHVVVPEIDAGEILIQMETPISRKTTSFSLLREYTKLATDSFDRILDKLTIEINKEIKQTSKELSLYYSWQKPNNGELNLAWNESKISAFLRSMDYGPLETLGLVWFEFNGIKYQVKKYKMSESLELKNSFNLTNSEQTFILNKGNLEFILDKLEKI